MDGSTVPGQDLHKPIYVTKPFLPPLEEFNEFLTEIWASGTLSNGGPMHVRLEQALADYLRVPYVSLFANATIALVTALQTLRITGEVITTPFSFVATTHALLWNGIKPRFVDIDPVTMNLDPRQIEAAITPATTAIMPVHVYGQPAALEEIREIADRYGLRLIYDAAHAFGVRDAQDRALAWHGDLSIISFHATKIFNTFEGGLLVSHDQATKTRIDRLKNFGFVDETTVVAPGINGKMSEIHAAMGLLQLRHIDHILTRRRQVAETYDAALEDLSGIELVRYADADRHNYSYYPVLIGDGTDGGTLRNAVYEALKTEGIYARRYFYPLITSFPMYRGLPSATPANLPVATNIANRVLCLPIYPGLDSDDQARIVAALRKALS